MIPRVTVQAKNTPHKPTNGVGGQDRGRAIPEAPRPPFTAPDLGWLHKEHRARDNDPHQVIDLSWRLHLPGLECLPAAFQERAPGP